MTTLGTLNLDFQIFGCSWDGDVAERTALVVERGETFLLPMWDRTARDIFDEWLVIRGDRQRVPERFALPWLAEHLIRARKVQRP